MKKNYFILLFLFSLIVSQACIAQTIDIPDAVLKQKLVSYSNPVIDTNGDGEIQVSEAQIVESLNLVSFGGLENKIQDITGLEMFSNLTNLYLKNNMITGADFSSFTNLTELLLSNNFITETSSFVFSNSIKNLYLGNNSISSLNLSTLGDLEELYIYNNYLSELNDENLPPNITRILAYDNNISSISLSNLTELNKLYLQNNQLESIQSVSLPVNLEEINLSDNNFITDNGIQLSESVNLKVISLSDNNFNSFSQQNLPIGIESINLSSNNLINFSGSDFPSLKNLDLSNNEITDIDPNWLSLEDLLLDNNYLESFDASGFENLKSLSLEGNSLISLNVSELSQLEELIVANCDLETLETGNLPFLNALDIDNNNLSEIDLSQFPSLVFIFMGGNLFTELDFSNNPLLGGDFGVSNLPNLEYLNIKNGNNLPLYIFNCPNLESICVDDVNLYDNFPNYNITNACDFYNSINGTIKLDLGLGCNDNTSITLPGLMVKAFQTTENETSSVSFTNSNGNYLLYVGEGDFTIEAIHELEYYAISPASEEIYFEGFNETQEVDFCLEPTETVTDLNVTLLPTTQARPGFQANYELVIKNRGTQTVDQATITLSFNENSQSFISASETVTSQNTNQISFEVNNLPPFGTQTIDLYMQTFEPPVVIGGDELNFTTTVTPNENDYTPEDNTFDLSQIVVNSFDPNDKRVLQGDEITIEEADEYLDYIIRFQNTGTASAINVRVEDNLNSKLDWSTFQILSSSADFRVEITDETHVEFIFDEINLPYEGEDEEGSQGYIAYKIKPKADVEIGDVISGDASIYFDFNAPIITNTVSTEIVENLSIENYDLNDNISVYPNPANDLLKIKTSPSVEVEQADIFNLQGQKLLSFRKNLKSIHLENLSSGMYILQLKTNKGNLNLQLIKE